MKFVALLFTRRLKRHKGTVSLVDLIRKHVVTPLKNMLATAAITTLTLLSNLVCIKYLLNTQLLATSIRIPTVKNVQLQNR